MYESQKTIEHRKEIISIIKKIMVDRKEQELKCLVAGISIETGYNIKFIYEIIDTLKDTGFLYVGANGLVSLAE